MSYSEVVENELVQSRVWGGGGIIWGGGKTLGMGAFTQKYYSVIPASTFVIFDVDSTLNFDVDFRRFFNVQYKTRWNIDVSKSNVKISST